MVAMYVIAGSVVLMAKIEVSYCLGFDVCFNPDICKISVNRKGTLEPLLVIPFPKSDSGLLFGKRVYNAIVRSNS